MFSPRFEHWLALALVLLAATAALSRVSRIWWTGRLLVDASTRDTYRVIIFFVASLGYAILLVTDPSQRLPTFLSALLLGTGLNLLPNGSDTLEIRERGIFCDSRLISWNRIRAWYWEHPGKRTPFSWLRSGQSDTAPLKIELSKRSVFLERSVRLRIPRNRVDAFSQAMHQHALDNEKEFSGVRPVPGS